MSDGSYCRFCGDPSLLDRIATMERDHGLLQIAHDHKATLLESCETALGERDKQIAALEKVAEAVLEFNGSSGLASVRAWNAVKTAMRAAGYDVTKEHIL